MVQAPFRTGVFEGTLGEAMEDLEPTPTGVGVFEIEDGSGTWEVGGYFTEAPDDIELALLAAVSDEGLQRAGACGQTWVIEMVGWR